MRVVTVGSVNIDKRDLRENGLNRLPRRRGEREDPFSRPVVPWHSRARIAAGSPGALAKRRGVGRSDRRALCNVSQPLKGTT
jgi:hypothetical protein